MTLAWKPRVSLALVVAIVAAVLVATPQAEARPVGSFDPGYIISDQEFYNGYAMTASDIQKFLNSKVSNCVSGYTCLKDYHQPTPNIAPDAFCDGYVGAPDETAAEIIAKVGKSCNISQKALLVTLQKEQGLVTHVWPSDWRYDKALGYACSDSAPCDGAFKGFVYQMYYGARQFQRYAQLPTRYNYQAGRTNNILFHPNSSKCGYSRVYITNLATAGLYNYTPYQPNSAALNNLYGTGDSCSSYGNRNFWRYYWDWFGSPIESNVLLRTKESTTVYFISGETKHQIPSLEVYRELRTLGGVGYVTQEYLDSFSDGPMVGSNFRNTSGRIAMLDRGNMLSYPSCGMLLDFGYSCSADHYVQLDNAQMSLFPNGPTLTELVGTDTGARYLVQEGVKREIADEQAQVAAGITASMVVLSDNSVAHLTLGAPIVSEPALVRNRGTGEYGVLYDGQLHMVPVGEETAFTGANITQSSLSNASFSQLPAAATTISGIAVDSAGTTYALTRDGRFSVDPALLRSESDPTALPDDLLALWPNLGALTESMLIKATDRASVYLLTDAGLRQFSSFAAYSSVTSHGDWAFTLVPPTVVSALKAGPRILPAGAMVRTSSNPRIYYIDGLTQALPLSSFEISSAAGVFGYSTVAESDLAGYPTSSDYFGYGMRCDGVAHVAANGAIHEVATEDEGRWPIDFVDLDRYTCATLDRGAAMGSFVRAPNGAIYQLEDGQKRPISSWSRWLELSDGAAWVNIDNRLAAAIPTGPRA
ncbi:hypothetical protein [Demequina sp.]|uniref:hypothetical protein n=1 Tax=Demequina sp. TaxID=2050685 RepID=UPI0025BC5F48|nr:hypothetical protein [Demequina sp.]